MHRSSLILCFIGIWIIPVPGRTQELSIPLIRASSLGIASQPAEFQVLTGPFADATFASIQGLSGWELKSSPLVPGFSDETFLVRFAFHNDSESQEFCIENPVGYVNEVALLPRTGPVRLLGSAHAVGPVRHRNHPYPVFCLSIAQGKVEIIVLRYRSGSALLIEPLLRRAFALDDSIGLHRDLQVLYFGCLLILLLLHSYGLFRTRNPDFLFFSLYIISTFLYQFAYVGFLRVYVFDSGGAWLGSLLVSLGAFNLAALLAFSIRYLRIVRSESMGVLAHGPVYILVAYSVLSWLLPLSVADPTVHVLAMISIASFSGILIYRSFRGSRSAVWMTITLGFLLLSIVTFNLFALGFSVPANFGRHAVQIGTLAQIFIMNLSLLDRYSLPEPLASIPRVPISKGKSRLGGIDVDETMRSVHTLLESTRIYCDEDLRLQRLASLVELRPDQLGELINRSTGLRFNDYLNQFRIREAQRIMETEPQRSILDVCFSVGFNSKSTIYSAFKKELGKTPGEVRAGHR